ncbi:Rhs element Vgr protein [Salinisphaera sp. S4-8]
MSSTSFDYKRKANISAGLPTDTRYGADGAPVLEAYDYAGPYAWASAAEAERYTRLALEAAEARTKTWHGESSVRTLRCGRLFTLTESNLDQLASATGDEDERKRQFLVLSVSHVGINNLPNDLAKRIEARLGKIPAAHGEQADPDLLAQAKQTGYANRFDAIRRDVPWRPVLADDTGLRFNPRPTAPGAQTATVVGPDGATAPAGADELHTDALGRIKVRFHWQAGEAADDRLTCWIRCVQRDAGAGHGQQFIPRIGQEVLVQFLGGDIDRPVVTSSLYNGQGEAGTPATPGGTQRESDTSAYQQAADHAPSAQGNLASDQAPAWHGSAAGDNDHRNAAALSGTKTQEFGGSGHNQLVFDDTDGQQRVQLATTQAHSQLNLGHLIHQADNFRGSFRGTGFELRTDAYGAVRGERGVLLSTYGIQPSEPAGDFTAGQALLKQANQLGESYSQIATTHTTTALAAHLGATKANQSTIDPEASPLAALLKTAQGQVDAADWNKATEDAANKNTALSDTKRPHPADPILAIAAKAGLGVVAGQDVHWHADETLTVASGSDSNWAIGERLHIHSGQSIGVLAGVQGSGDGLKLIAGQGDLDLQAQADQMKVQSKDSLKIASANAEGEFAGKKAVKLATADGASVTLEGGKITVACPGTLTVHAGNKVFTGPGHAERGLPHMGGPIQPLHWVGVKGQYDDRWQTPITDTKTFADINGERAFAWGEDQVGFLQQVGGWASSAGSWIVGQGEDLVDWYSDLPMLGKVFPVAYAAGEGIDAAGDALEDASEEIQRLWAQREALFEFFKALYEQSVDAVQITIETLAAMGGELGELDRDVSRKRDIAEDIRISRCTVRGPAAQSLGRRHRRWRGLYRARAADLSRLGSSRCH